MVKVLVEDYLCDPGVRDKSGRTPADWARSKDHTHITYYLSSIEMVVSSECDYHCWNAEHNGVINYRSREGSSVADFCFDQYCNSILCTLIEQF